MDISDAMEFVFAPEQAGMTAREIIAEIRARWGDSVADAVRAEFRRSGTEWNEQNA
jgi:hypothetical protein